MSSIKSMQYLKHKAITPRKIKNLVNKALKDGFKIKPSKGMFFLEDLKSNDLFETSTGMQGVCLESNDTSAKVIITKVDHIPEEDRQFYIGYRNIASKTEVTILRSANDKEV